MANSPEATVQLLYDMFAQGKVQELLDACCAEDVRWVSPGDPAKLPWAACDVTGRAAVLQFIYGMGAEAEFLDAERPQPWIVQDACTAGPEGTQVAVLSSCKVVYKKTGKSCAHSACHVFRLRQSAGGQWLIHWVKEFSDSAALLRLTEA